MLTIEQMQDNYYVLRLETESIEMVKVLKEIEGVNAETLEREPKGFILVAKL